MLARFGPVIVDVNQIRAVFFAQPEGEDEEVGVIQFQDGKEIEIHKTVGEAIMDWFKTLEAEAIKSPLRERLSVLPYFRDLAAKQALTEELTKTQLPPRPRAPARAPDRQT